MDVDEEKRRGREAGQSLAGTWSLKENIGAKACLPVRCAVITSKERGVVWQEPSVKETLQSTGKEHTCNTPAAIATNTWVASSAELLFFP